MVRDRIAGVALCSMLLFACGKGDGDGDGDGDAPGDGDCDGEPSPCTNNDDWEPNDLSGAAAMVEWDSISQWSASVTIEAFLCPDEHDWYRVDVDSLTFDHYALHLDLIVAGSSWCGMSCDDPWLPNAPEHAVSVEVYDADTMALLTEGTVGDGRVDLGGFGPAFAHDLAIHVSGPTPAATYPYSLHVEIRGYDGEDECEC